MSKWQHTSFFTMEKLIDWMNKWTFIKIVHIVPYQAAGTEYFAALYRYKRHIGPDESPSYQEKKESLYT